MFPDEQFAQYKILSQLGRGGMAVVYKVQDIQTHQIVALKVLHEHYSTNEEVIQRFNREADIFYRLKHPNIVPIIDHGVEDGTFYIATAYMAGGTLFESFQNPLEVDLKFTIGILEQLASALDYAHKQGIVHRDLKLENILLDDKKKPFLADFGIALLIDSTRLTAHQTSLGTPMYMSPEQASGRDVTSLSDLYSLAVMAYLMTTGYYPFTNVDPYVVLFQHVKQAPPVPTMVNKALPRAINAVLLRGLEKDPNKRFQTASEFIKALKNALTEDSFKTQTYIQLTALNPLAIQPNENSKETLVDGIIPTATSSSLPQSRANPNRRLMVGGIGLFAVVIVGIILALVISSNNQAIDLANAQTQVRQEFELELTQTAQALELAIIQTQVQQEFELTQTAQAIKDQLPTGIISRPEGARLRSSPAPNAIDLGYVPFDETATLLGRSDSGDFVEIETADGMTGFIKIEQIDFTVNVMTLPITHVPEQEDNNNGSCNPDPFGYLIEDDVPILAAPNLNAQVLMTRPEQDRLKLIGRDADDEFYEVEVNDPDRTHGFVLREQFFADADLSCLRVIPPKEP